MTTLSGGAVGVGPTRLRASWLAAGVAAVLAALVLGMTVGPVAIRPGAAVEELLSHFPLLGVHSSLSAQQATIVSQLRLPRVVLGLLVGSMLAMAGARLGFDIAVLTPHADAPASRVAARTILAAHDDPAALAALAQTCAAITFEFENVPAAARGRLEALGAPAAPGARALAIAQDRLEEKRFLGEAQAAGL